MSVCSGDIESFCSGAAPDKVIDCLAESVKKNKSVLGLECSKAVFSNLKEQSEDIRLDPTLFGTCTNELNSFCADAKFGDSKKKKCLFNSRVAFPCLVAPLISLQMI